MSVGSTGRNGFTIIELASTVAAGVILASAGVPMLSHAVDLSMREQSRANLHGLHGIHTMYALDNEDRQFSAIPDDFDGRCTQYQQANGCIDPLVLGFDPDGTRWAYNLGCGGSGGSCGNIVTFEACSFGESRYGAYRLANTASINTYADGRFFDPLFFAPDDPALREGDVKAMRAGVDFMFTQPANGFARTSYAMSPAAMWAPRVFGDGQRLKTAQFRQPNAAASDWATPRVPQCEHPSLKTRMMEHYATNHAPAPCHPAYGGCVPYLWNQSFETRNLALFFDGSVDGFGVLDSIALEDAVGAKMWLRNTPFGALGVEGGLAHQGVTSSAHFLTTFGIRGRDRLQPVD
jgi:hypothetical protein